MTDMISVIEQYLVFAIIYCNEGVMDKLMQVDLL